MADAVATLQSSAPGSTGLQVVGLPTTTGIFLDGDEEAAQFPVPTYDEVFAQSDDSEGGKRVRSTPQNAKGSFKVNIAGATAAAFWANVEIWEQLINEMHDWGGTIVWTPVNGLQVTYDIESIAITELPQRDVVQRQNILLGSTAEFTALPFGRLAVLTNVTLSDIDTFWRDSVANQEWRFDAGSSSLLLVSGGVLNPTSTAEKKIYRPLNVVDVTQAVIKVVTGAAVASGDTGITLKRLPASGGAIANELRARVEFAGASSLLRIAKWTSPATEVSIVASGTFTTVALTNYWLQASVVGNVVTVKLFSQDPNATTNPTQLGSTLTTTLAGGDATLYGTGVRGSPGIRFNPQDTSYRLDDWRLDSGSLEGFGPSLDFAVFNIPGSASALPKLRLTDMSSQARNYVEWGLDDRYFTKATPLPIMLDSDVLSLTGLSGVGTTLAGAYDPEALSSSCIRSLALSSTPIAIGSTGTLTHTGTLRIKARLQGVAAASTALGPIYVRFAYRIADGPWSRTGWVKVIQTVVTGGATSWYDQTLGVIRIPPTLLGSQSWEGRVEAYTAGSTGDLVYVDYLRAIPAKRYGRVRYLPDPLETPTVFSARSDADTESGVITGDALSIGGTWVGAGSANDFSQTTLAPFGNVLTRTAISDTGAAAVIPLGRLVTASTPTLSDCAARIDFRTGVIGIVEQGLILRYTDINNFIAVFLTWSVFVPYIYVLHYVAGNPFIIEPRPSLGAGSIAINNFYTLIAAVDSAGTLNAYWGPQGVKPGRVWNGSSPHWAAGGALASGKVGIVDHYPSAVANSRYYDNFQAWVPEQHPVIPSGGNLEVRHNAVVTSSGARLSPEYAYPKIEPSGRDGRGARVMVAARRFDSELSPDTTITDGLKAELDITPRVVLLDG